MALPVQKKETSSLFSERGGPGNKGWPMGRTVHLSEMYYLVEQVNGVDYVKHLALSPWGSKSKFERIKIPPFGFPFLRDITIEFVSE